MQNFLLLTNSVCVCLILKGSGSSLIETRAHSSGAVTMVSYMVKQLLVRVILSVIMSHLLSYITSPEYLTPSTVCSEP